MLLDIRHTTRYRFSQPIHSAIQYLRLTPRPDINQVTEIWNLSAPGRLTPQTDAWGNLMHVQTLDGATDEFAITVTGRVRTHDTVGLLPGDDRIPTGVFLRPTDLTAPDDRVRDFVAPLVPSVRADTLDGLHELARAISAAVRYAGETTDVTSTAGDALAQGAGVCQDQAHVFVSAARVLGIPTRYVSGYVHVAGGGTQMNDRGASRTASHAWAESWVENLGWVAFDVTNEICANDAHLRLAVGPDYLACAPVRGVRRGGGAESMEVEVEVALAQGAQ